MLTINDKIMEQFNEKPFEIKLIKEKQYYRLYVTHPNFKGRIRKRLGGRSYAVLENIGFTLRYELGKHFTGSNYKKSEVESFIDNFIALNVKCTASIFEYKEGFLKTKREQLNERTQKRTSLSTISSYMTALMYFEEFLKIEKIAPHPSQITKSVLNNFYLYLSGGHNYKVKLHTKAKGFIIYLANEKALPIDPSYTLSVFREQYDNQNPTVTDVALTEEEVYKLIDLRKKLQNGEVVIEKYKKSGKIPVELQEQQFNMKKENLIKCLDCYLLMISTGMYYADVMKSVLYFNRGESVRYMNYRRAKTNSLCVGIPIINDGIFIGKDIIDQYKIKNGSNFPLNLSLTHFDKHLERIGVLADIGFKITNKMARKTFATYLHFTKNMPIHYVKKLLGHKDESETSHYLRIKNDDIANEIVKWLSNNTPNK